MSELVQAAAEILVPFVGAGAGAVAGGSAEEAGADLYRLATGVIAKLGHRLKGRTAKDLEAAIDEALAGDVVSQAELQDLVRAAQAPVVGAVDIRKAKNVFVGTTHIGTFNG